ncbi:MAG: hypothetical protein AB8B53_11045 [Flavobacteriales bacterium]
MAAVLKHKISGLFPAKVREVERVKKGCNLNNGISIALIFVDRDEKYLNAKKKYLQSLKGDHGVREAVILTYVDEFEKDVPSHLSKLKELDYFTREDLNWRQKPISVLDSFCKKRYDILLDLTVEECAPLSHVMANSLAGLKVCRKGSQNQEFADIIVDIEEQNSEQDFLLQTKQMLSKLSFN